MNTQHSADQFFESILNPQRRTTSQQAKRCARNERWLMTTALLCCRNRMWWTEKTHTRSHRWSCTGSQLPSYTANGGWEWSEVSQWFWVSHCTLASNSNYSDRKLFLSITEPTKLFQMRNRSSEIWNYWIILKNKRYISKQIWSKLWIFFLKVESILHQYNTSKFLLTQLHKIYTTIVFG